VLVTSRRHLTALEDTQTISLDMLSAGEAAELLIRLAARPDLEPSDPAVAEIIRLCGCLPLAVGMLARQLHHHPAWTPAGLAGDLAAARDRLELMAAENVSVAAAFDLSYADLTPGQQLLFRRLGLHPGTDIDAYAAAALDGTDLAAARRRLDALYDQCLLTEPARGRYRLHDLIREHARTLAAADPAAETDAALGRLLDYYQRTAAIAEARLARQPRTTPGPAALTSPPAAAPGLPDLTWALSWARAERASLLACLDHATRTGQYARVVALTAAMAALLRHDGPWTDALTRHTTAVQAARHLGDRLGEAGALNDLGTVRQLAADYPGAAEALEEALGICRDLGDRLGQAEALCWLGVVWRLTGDYPGAAGALEAALGICRDLGYRAAEAEVLNEVGTLHRVRGDLDQAEAYHRQALDLAREIANSGDEAYALAGLARCALAAGRTADAQADLQQAQEIFQRIGAAEVTSVAAELDALTEAGPAAGKDP
jgi:tetratricopeptide (TPR) repeat protein